MKRCLAIILIVSCLLTLCPMTLTAFAHETKQKGGKLIALTFDDGPCGYTPRLLDGLAERNVSVTFFTVGTMIEAYPNTLRRAFNEGHEIAQHTYSHPTLTTKSDSQVQWEIGHTDELLDDCLGMDLDYNLRPPYGDVNDRVLSLIGCPSIMWSLDSLDWQLLNAQKVCDRIVANAFDGAVVLVHDIHSTSVSGALMAIDILLEQGYEFVTVSELYRRRGFRLEDGKNYYSCKANGTDLGPIEPPTIHAEPIYGGYRISMTSADGTTIYYSTDGSAPTVAYTGEFTLSAGQTLKAFSCYEINRGRSETVTKTVDTSALQTPTVRSENGFYYLESPDENADIRYTADGSRPTADSTLYEGPIPWFDGTLRFCAMTYGGCSESVFYYVSRNGNLFLDVAPDSWYFDEVDRAVSLGLLNGTEPYRYEPNSGLTRAMFVTIIHRMMRQNGMDVSVQKEAEFTDTLSGSWYSEAVSWSAESGLVLGYEDGSFRPNRSITREEMCVIIDRLLTMLQVDSPEAEPAFSDNDEISRWAYLSVGRLVEIGIILGVGNGRFAPQNTATRAEASTVLLRLYDLLQKSS